MLQQRATAHPTLVGRVRAQVMRRLRIAAVAAAVMPLAVVVDTLAAAVVDMLAAAVVVMAAVAADTGNQ